VVATLAPDGEGLVWDWCYAPEAVPFESYSDDFLFDTEILVAAVVDGLRLDEVATPTRSTKESSSINVRRCLEYIWRSIEVCWRASGTRRRQPRVPGD
jgi:hypothetical protein